MATTKIDLAKQSQVSADVDWNSKKITGLADPTNPQDAATKSFVDAARAGLDVKQSVRAASVGNLALSGTQTVDGVSLSVGDRALVKNQTAPAENGVYVVASGAWTRATDADVDAEVTSGMFCFVEEGTVNADTGWVLTTNNPITIGSTSLAFTKFSTTSVFTISEAEIDVGATPVAEAVITVTDAGVSAASRIIGGIAYEAPTDKDLDELEMDALDLKFLPAAGSFDVRIKGLEGYIADKFKIWYTYA